MTNKEDENDTTRDCNPRMAALLAVHLVSQVLDEAYVIANTARETGQSWRNLSMVKSYKDGRLSDSYAEEEPVSFEASKGDSENNMEVIANVVATSTPQKLASKHIRCSDDTQIIHSDFIGQGDEDIEAQRHEDTSNSTSMFINHLFDMSEVEHVVVSEDQDYETNDCETHQILAEDFVKMMDTYVTNTIMTIEVPILTDDIKEQSTPVYTDTTITKSDHSDFSFLTDAYDGVGKNVAFFIDEDLQRDSGYIRHNDAVGKIVEITEESRYMTKAEQQKNDVDMYEKAYMTLNRDFDQCSDEDGFPVLQDPKEMTLQEVELFTSNASEENMSYNGDARLKEKEEAGTLVTSGSRRSTLARRCRMHGARLFACIRGWWQRRTPAKRRESRMSDAVKGMTCPLSPEARRRTSSMLDGRRNRSPSPSHQVLWKFNTVNEALVNSNRWKDYTFESNPENCD